MMPTMVTFSGYNLTAVVDFYCAFAIILTSLALNQGAQMVEAPRARQYETLSAMEEYGNNSAPTME